VLTAKTWPSQWPGFFCRSDFNENSPLLRAAHLRAAHLRAAHLLALAVRLSFSYASKAFAIGPRKQRFELNEE
jgi:hypothetical protein